MKRIIYLICLYCVVGFFIGETAAGEMPSPVFHVSFDQTADPDIAKVDIRCNSPAQLTDENCGVKGRGGLFASGNLKDFLDVKNRDSHPREIRGGFKYTGQSPINAEEGTAEIWVKPYFNEELAPGSICDVYCIVSASKQTPGKSAGKIGIYLAIYGDVGKDPNFQAALQKKKPGSIPDELLKGASDKFWRPAGKVKHYLDFSFETADGVMNQIVTEISDWQPKTWHHVAAVWTMKEKSLFVDGNKRGLKKIEGAINVDKNCLNIGGSIYSTKSFQGVLDEFKVYDKAVYISDFTPLP